MKTKLLALVASVLLLSSCSLTQYLANGAAVVDQHCQENNIVALIDDLEKYPIYRNTIEDYLFHKADYSQLTYSDLKQIAGKAVNLVSDVAFFNNLLGNKQNSILSYLGGLPLQEVLSYYQGHSDTEDFLFEAIQKMCFSNLGGMDYSSLKNIWQIFGNSDFSSLIEPTYTSLRTSLLNNIMSELDQKVAGENDLFSQLQTSMRSFLGDYVKNGVSNIISGMTKQVEANLLNKLLKRDNTQSLTDCFAGLLKSELSSASVGNYISSAVSGFMSSSNQSRQSLLQQYLPDTDASSLAGCYMSESLVSSNPFEFLISQNDFSLSNLTDSSKKTAGLNSLSQAVSAGASGNIDDYLNGLFSSMQSANASSVETMKQTILREF